MFKNLISLYYPKYPLALVSLMHEGHYDTASYIRRLHKTKDFSLPLKKPAARSKNVQLALVLLSLGMTLQIAAGTLVIVLGIGNHIAGGIFFGLAIILLYPLVWAYLSVLALVFRDWYKVGLSSDKAE